MKWHPIVVLICITLISRDVEHLLKYLFGPLCLWKKCLLRSFALLLFFSLFKLSKNISSISPATLPTPASGNHQYILCIYKCVLVVVFDSTWNRDGTVFICSSFSVLFFLSQRPWGPSMLMQWLDFILFYGWIISHCRYVPQFLYPFIHLRIGCFHISVIVNNAAMNIGMYISLWASVLFSL